MYQLGVAKANGGTRLFLDTCTHIVRYETTRDRRYYVFVFDTQGKIDERTVPDGVWFSPFAATSAFLRDILSVVMERFEPNLNFTVPLARAILKIELDGKLDLGELKCNK
jgi:hypothetical protein